MKSILVIYPEVEITKIAVYRNTSLIFLKSIKHKADDLAAFADVTDQLDYRTQLILQELNNKLSRIKIERLCLIIFIMRIYYLSFCKTRKPFKYFMLSNILRYHPGCTPGILKVESACDAIHINYFTGKE